ncbi:ABC transporter permease subunit [Saccharopolyspora indica]|uniref:ABC transporter permease subunit n=1 Tax=Saccharopolyspora indica TaxID=1229659 RepID=UPI0022EB2379|nr:ABC transporter permease subunit [Saccharopolyspora indica]MDA3644837.1 ABC transporter permease subunit [Saccharopolyspora indica]
MIWVTWRQHRAGMAVLAAVFLGAAGIFLLADALGATAQVVFDAQSGFAELVRIGEQIGAIRLLPLLIGVFVGAPLVSREVEQRTCRYSWTQGVSRIRWLSTKVLLLGAVVLLLSAVYTAVHMWWFEPVAGQQGWFTIYNQAGVVFPAYCLFSFALGVAVGTVVKQSVAAMAITLVGSAAAMIGMWVLRRGFAEPVTVSAPAGSSTVDEMAQGGHIMSFGSGAEISYVTFHPAERFWPFQFTEASIVLALTLFALALAFWWLRRKLS